jgi:hypothetical protein
MSQSDVWHNKCWSSRMFAMFPQAYPPVNVGLRSKTRSTSALPLDWLTFRIRSTLMKMSVFPMDENGTWVFFHCPF